MHLSNLKLWAFRKFGSNAAFSPDAPHLDLGFNSGLNVLIGENDFGNSAIIDAIRLVLKTHSYDWLRIDDNDFYLGQNQLRIELVLSGFKPEDEPLFPAIVPLAPRPRPFDLIPCHEA